MSVFCVNCGTENMEDYNFCKNCGVRLIKREQLQPVSNYKQQAVNEDPKKETIKENTEKAQVDTYIKEDESEIFGTKRRYLKAFIGNNSTKVLSRFEGMQLADSIVSFCFPAFILSLFFGFFGLAIWLFYRKMDKFAWLAVLLGTAFFVVSNILCYPYMASLVSEILSTYSDFRQGASATLYKELLNRISSIDVGANFTGIISDIEKIASVLIGGLYGLNFYKNHVLENVSDIIQGSEDPENIEADLRESGGTSIGKAALGATLMVVIKTIVFIALMTIVILSI